MHNNQRVWQAAVFWRGRLAEVAGWLWRILQAAQRSLRKITTGFQHANGLVFSQYRPLLLGISAHPQNYAKRTVPQPAHPPPIGYCIHLLIGSKYDGEKRNANHEIRENHCTAQYSRALAWPIQSGNRPTNHKPHTP